MVNYLPIAVMALICFLAASVILWPLAYIAAIAKKVQLLSTSRRVKRASVMDLLMFILCGWAILFLTIFKDAFQYWMHLYCLSYTSIKEKFSMENFTMAEFIEF